MSVNKNKAGLTLLFSAAGFLVSYPFQYNFWGGLAAGGFGAALVGGLADWFAVSALFRKPLGISFRTAIIPRNRDKIFKELASTVENQLLTKENLMRTLDSYDITTVIINHMTTHGGKTAFEQVMYHFCKDLLARVEPGELGEILAQTARANAAKIRLAPFLVESSEWLFDNGYDDKLIDYLINHLVLLSKHEQFRSMLSDLFQEARQTYERGMNRRRIFNEILNLSPEQIASIIQKALAAFLSEMYDNNHPLRIRAKEKLGLMRYQLKNDGKLAEQIEYWKDEKLREMELAPHIVRLITALKDVLMVDTAEGNELWATLRMVMDKLVTDFIDNPEDRKTVDRLVKRVLGNWVENYHQEIGKMVSESLNHFSNEQLVQFIESKVGNDLQMIRINGSLVGGMAGAVLYLLTFWL